MVMKFVFLFLPFFVSLGFGQKPKDSLLQRSLDEVVVTASRTPRLLGNTAVPVSVISSKALYQTGSLRLNEILTEQTGIVFTDDFGKGVQIQGLSSEYALILVDGEPLIGRTGGVLDLSRISVRNIRKIEIIKGPSSSLYGSEALGGVINIITDRSGQNKTDLALRYGRFNTLDATFNFSRRFNKTDVQGSLNHNRSEGYSLRPNSIQQTVEPYRRGNQQFSIHHTFSPHLKIGTGIRHNSTHIENTIAVQNGGVIIASKGFEKNSEYNLTPYIAHTSRHFKTVLRGYVTGFNAKQELSVGNGSDRYNDLFSQQFNRIEIQSDWKPRERSTVTAGAGQIGEFVTSNRYDSLSTRRKNHITYLFVQHEEQLNKKMTFIGGFRFDANKAFASVWSPKAALQYKMNETFSFNISYGRGFKAPDFRQLYLNFTNLAAGSYTVFGSEVAAPELARLSAQGQLDQVTSLSANLGQLMPEVSGGVNAGMRAQLNTSTRATLNLFRNDLKNMIVTDVIAFKRNGGQIFSYFNLKSAVTQGFEVELEKVISKQLTVKTGYQYLVTADKEILRSIRVGQLFQRDLKTGSVSRMNQADYGGLPFRSKHTANIKLNYEVPSGTFFTVRALYRSQWGTSDKDGNGVINRSDEYANGYIQINTSAGFTYAQWKIMAGIDNLFNYKDIQFLPGNPGRTGYIDVQFHF